MLYGCEGGQGRASRKAWPVLIVMDLGAGVCYCSRSEALQLAFGHLLRQQDEATGVTWSVCWGALHVEQLHVASKSFQFPCSALKVLWKHVPRSALLSEARKKRSVFSHPAAHQKLTAAYWSCPSPLEAKTIFLCVQVSSV